jgi:hypothetical protein
MIGVRVRLFGTTSSLVHVIRPRRRYVHNMNAGHLLGFARVDFRNNDRVFGVKDEDRFLHIYVIGKTGTGKSTLLETMALQDLQRGNRSASILAA